MAIPAKDASAQRSDQRGTVLPRGHRYPGDLRADLLTAALDLIAEHGPDAVTIRSVAARVGVSHAAPARWYPTKGHLLTAVATQAFRELVDAVALVLDGPQGRLGSLHKLRACAWAYLDFAATHPGHFAVMWREDLLLHDPDLQAAGEASLEQFLAAVHTAMADHWAPGRDPQAVADLTWSTVHGLAVLRANGPYQALDPREFRDRATRAFDTLAAALAT